MFNEGDGTVVGDLISIGEFFYQLLLLIGNALEIIREATIQLDEIDFESSIFDQYLGYAKYVMGDGLYALFTSVILIALGATAWTYLLKGIGYIKELLPWG